MTTGIPSGLGATLGLALETTVGTFLAPTRWVPFQKESLKYKKNVVQSKALHGGLYDLATRRQAVTHGATGAVTVDLADRNLGIVFESALGAAPNITAATGYSTMVFAPGTGTGISLSAQVGRPMTNGTIQAFSYSGLKVTDWEIQVQTGSAAANFNVTFDGWNEDISQTYAAPSWVASDIFTFTGAALYTGGTVSTTGGVSSVTGSTQLAVARSASVKGTNALKTDRYFLGSSGTKAEQIANNFRQITGQLDLDFENTSDVLTAFYADSGLALELTFTGPIITGTTHSSLQVLIPQIRWDDGASPAVEGPDVLHQTANFTGLDNGTDNPVQITIVTADTAA